MNQFRAKVDIFYPTDAKVLKALANGENPPLRARGMKHVKAGDIVSDIPAVSVAGLLEAGRIEEVKDGGI